jgi:uncharacterized membrane protein YciS (DUF1049 family)
MIRLILIGIILILSLTFFLQNQEQEVTFRYLFGLKEASTKVYKPIFSAFVVGIVIATILLFPGWAKARIQLRRMTKSLQETEADLERTRKSQRKLEQALRDAGLRESQEVLDE